LQQAVAIAPPGAYLQTILDKLRDVQGGFEDFQKASELFKQQGKIEEHYDAVAKIKQLW